MANKDLNKIIKQIEANGFTVVHGGKKYKVQDAQGRTVYGLPKTPGGGRWKQNLIHDLKRKGILP